MPSVVRIKRKKTIRDRLAKATVERMVLGSGVSAAELMKDVRSGSFKIRGNERAALNILSGKKFTMDEVLRRTDAQLYLSRLERGQARIVPDEEAIIRLRGSIRDLRSIISETDTKSQAKESPGINVSRMDIRN